jgi:hypothetical protein
LIRANDDFAADAKAAKKKLTTDAGVGRGRKQNIRLASALPELPLPS